MRPIGGFILLLILGALCVGPAERAGAQVQPSPTDITRALKPRPLTRSIGSSATTPNDQSFLETLRTKTTRSITVEERTKTAELAKAKPSIDLEVMFEFDSAEIGS